MKSIRFISSRFLPLSCLSLSIAIKSSLRRNGQGFCAFVLGSLGLLVASPRGQAQVTQYAYATDFGSDAVSVFAVDANTGALTPVSVAPTGTGPFWVGVDPAGRFVYVSNSSETTGVPSISVYSVDQNTGALTPVRGSPFPTGLGSPQGLVVHPSGNFLYVAHDLLAGFVSAYSINAMTGALTPIPGSPYSTAGVNTWSVTTDPAGKFLFVANGGSGNIPAFTINATTGALTPVPGSPFASINDTDIAVVDPTSRFLYVDNTSSNTISGYTIDPNSGSLTPVTGSPFATGGSTPSEVVITPTGHFLYATNRNSSNVSAYSLDSNTGALTPLPGFPYPVGTSPFHATIDPTGRFLYVTNFGSNNVYALSINASTGALTPVPGSPFATGTAPLSIAIATVAPSTQLTIQPNSGGNTGNVTVQLFGGGVQNGATVKLTGLGPDIIGATVPSASVLTTTFTLTGATPGARDVIVTNPDGTSATLKGGFTVEQGGSPNITISIIGRDRIRFNKTQTYYGLIQNHGTVDAPNVAAFVNQTSNALSPTLNQGSQVPPSAFLGPVATLTSVFIPLPAVGPPNGSPVSCPFVNGGDHTIQPGDSCVAFEAAKAAAEAYLNSLYGARLLNLLVLESLIRLGICFNPSNPSSSTACDWLERIDSAFDSAITSAEVSENSLCALASAAGCPLNCNDPSDISALKVIGDSLKKTIDQLKQLFTLATIPPDQFNTLKSQVALFETQALALPSSLVFPPQSQPQPPDAIPLDNSSSLQVCAVGSLDPNSKNGAGGVGALQYVKGNLALPFSLSFGNDPSATAPAQSVTITDVLNTNLDLTTLTLGAVDLLDHVLTPPSVPLYLSPFTTTVDLRPANNLLLKVKVSLDTATGILTGNFQSLDPATNQPPTDPTVGFLPPGDEGGVFFTVRPKQGLQTNTQIQNQATIVFDVNPPMFTATWINTLDNTAPTSRVVVLPSIENSLNFPVQWTGTDLGAGIQDFTVYVSADGGPFTAFQTNTTATSATFTGQAGHTYGFYSIARDLVGNVETAKSAAEATTQVTTDTTPPVTTVAVSPGPNTNGWNNTNVLLTLNSTDNEPGGTGVKQITYSASGAQTIGNTVANSASTSFTVSTEGVTTVTFFGTDNAGNVEAAKTITVKIDKTPPVITASANPSVLWPPNGKMVAVTVSGTMSDNLSGINPGTAAFAVQDSYGLVQPSGPVSLASNGTYSFTISLEARRDGQDQTGRLYTIVVSGQDNAGNGGSATTSVIVPHDQGH